MKQLRKQLGERLGTDLSNKKALIKKLCREFFEKKLEKMSEPDTLFRVKTEVSPKFYFSPLLCLVEVVSCLEMLQLNERTCNIDLFYVAY
jgi:hypothetical protein